MIRTNLRLICVLLTACLIASTGPVPWAQAQQGKSKSGGLPGGNDNADVKLTSRLTVKVKPSDAEQVKFLFLYREESIEPDIVKKMADALNLTIKSRNWDTYKPKHKSTNRESKQEGKDTLKLTIGDIEEAFKSAGYGVKLTKADAARINADTPIEEIFKDDSPIVGFNINTKDNTAQLFELPIKLKGETEDETTGKVIAPKGKVIIRDIKKPINRLIVFTYNQTPETLEEFKEVFCKMYHNDCGGPIGNPIPLPDGINVKRYLTFTPKNPILNERDLIRELEPYKKFLPFKDELYSNEPKPDNYLSVRCVEYLPDGKCSQWEVCGFTSDGSVKCILVNGLVGQHLCLEY